MVKFRFQCSHKLACFFKPSCIPSLSLKVVRFYWLQLQITCKSGWFEHKQTKDIIKLFKWQHFLSQEQCINLFEITSMICVFSSNLSLRSCSVVLYTCSASANSAARSFSFSWTWRCSFKTVSLCCSSISWICCNSEAFSCSN